MLRHALDHGVNYLDLGYPYNLSQQENLSRLVSRALEDGYRDRVKLTAHLPSPFISSSEDFDRYLNQQLEWMEAGRIDFYLLAGLNRETWPKLQEMEVLPWAEGAIASGRIGRLGFSFHDHFQILRGILDDYNGWALAQFQFSFMDVDHNPGVGGLKYATEKGLAVIAAEPLRGGWLSKEPPPSVAKIWANAPQKRPLYERGLRWVWNHAEVATAVSDMSNMEQVVANVALADSARADSLSVAEEVVISQVREAYRSLRPIPCSSCRACMPCPQGIDIPRLFELYNDAVMYGDLETARSIYQQERHDIDQCNQCGACLDACAKELAILDWLKELSASAFG